MKSAKDPRHKKRRRVVKELFANIFLKQESSEFANQILNKTEIIDEYIKKAAPQWPIEKLNKIDLAILRLATYEMLESDTPEKVIIDEAVELAKEYGGESSPSFINGVMGNILKQLTKKDGKN